MARKRVSKEKSIRRTKLFTELIICAAIIGAGAYAVKTAADRSATVQKSHFYEKEEIKAPIEQPTTEPVDPNKIIFETSMVNTKDKFRGDLILVNEDHQYFGGDEKLVSILEKNDETGRSSFTSVNYDYTILEVVYEPMAKMIDAFYEKYGINDIMIFGSFRSTEFQQQLYEADLAQTGSEESTRVAKPGFSEHESGYAFDFSRYDPSNGAPIDYDGTGDYAWFTDNCYKYGFIIRYPEQKVDITKIQYEPWHFRYVGLAHAYYMTKSDLCMEEYIELLKEHPYDGEHLEFSDDSGNSYEIYFVASDDGAETTSVPVPTGRDYDISGNNVDGFIVTVYKDKTPSAAVEDSPSDDEAEENPDDGNQEE